MSIPMVHIPILVLRSNCDSQTIGKTSNGNQALKAFESVKPTETHGCLHSCVVT